MQANKNNRFNNLLEIFLSSLKLGLTSFGGPVAHLAYFKVEYVDRRKWLDDKLYADIIALCQFLPGPASSQVGMTIGMIRGGLIGGIISWLGFTLPSIVVLVVFAMLYGSFSLENAIFIHSLKIVAVAVVLHALIDLGKKLTPDKKRIAIAIIAATIMLVYPSAWMQILIILGAAVLGIFLFHEKKALNVNDISVKISKKTAVMSFSLLIALLFITPFLVKLTDNIYVRIFDSFFRVGSLVFGGGHVVLPMIEREVVGGLLSPDTFLAGYGMSQAVPGPLFTFASYLGTVMAGLSGATVATIAIFLPSFLLIIATLPFINELRKRTSFQRMLMAVNASVVGILLAAFYNPVLKSSILHANDFALALILFYLLHTWKVPAWLVVISGIIGGYVINIPSI